MHTFIFKVKIIVFINGHMDPPIMLTIEPRMVIIF